MKPVVLLRIASVLTFIHALLHTVGGVFAEADPGPAAVAVAAMKANQFPLMGNMRSYWDFYFGMGLCVSIFLTVEAVVFWLLSSLAKTEAARLKPILLTFAVGYLVFAVNSWRYFFVGPVIVEILIALCLVAAATAREPAAA
jgi:hypothetical protein